MQYINKTYRRSGALWEGRYKASLVESDNYLLKCYRYIELIPVSAGMVSTPDVYRWSSYHHHAWGKANALLSDHALYVQLANSPDTRRYLYRELCKAQIPEADIHIINESLSFNYPLGNERFRAQIEAALGRAVGQRQRGRPRVKGRVVK